MLNTSCYETLLFLNVSFVPVASLHFSALDEKLIAQTHYGNFYFSEEIKYILFLKTVNYTFILKINATEVCGILCRLLTSSGYL